MGHHIAELIVNLDALAHNYTTYSSYLPSCGRIVPIIKADAYGSGVVPVVMKLHQLGHTYFAVALLEEAFTLRRSGVTGNILVLNPDIVTVEGAWKYDIEIEVYSISLLEHIDRIARRREETIAIHLKYDTGMHRLGILKDEVDQAIDIITSNPYIKVAGLMSHLSSSEDPGDDDFTREQIARFDNFCALATKRLGYSPNRHIANTAAIVRFPDVPYELYRLGLGLYGINTASDVDLPLKKVHRLIAKIIQIKAVPKGDSVGYNRSTFMEKDSTIAIVNVGYADGINRLLSNRRYQVYINGHYADIVGNVSMDSLAVDITGMTDIKEYDEVEIFGENQPIERLAEASGTIVYEVLCGLSSRINRVYR